MATYDVVVKRTVILTLSEEEAQYLAGLTQNPPYDQAIEEENAESAKIRKEIFTALDRSLRDDY